MTIKQGHDRLPVSTARAHEKAVGLPSEGSDEGALARLFLAEVLVPVTDDMREARREMDLMHCVLINRLNHPVDFDAGRYASTITQIITARQGHVQFQGFENYPVLGKRQQDNIDVLLNAALDEKNPRSHIYTDFIKTAVAAAKDSSPTDPTPTGLYFWVTSGSFKPSDHAVLFQTVGGNDFYTWSKSKPRGSR